jgi:hypothetical protein
MILEPAGLVDALEEGLCDPEAVARQFVLLKPLKGQFQLLVMACGAGLKCVHDLLPGAPIVPGLNTLGPGVGDQLACDDLLGDPLHWLAIFFWCSTSR